MRDVLANPVKHVPTLNESNLDALVFNNPICAFLADCCLYAPNSHAALGGGAFRPSIDESERGMYVKNAYTEVYAAYVNYCKSNGYKHSAKARFVDRLKETINNFVKI
jgi:phage/plasmid-associated DNA primase